MAQKTQLDWFTAGAKVLVADGAQALTIDRLTTALGVTKGSFYHHFADFADYKQALLAHFEAEDSLRAIALIEQAGAPREKLARMFMLAVDADQRLALALQAWAMQDAAVKAVQTRVYARQLDYAITLFRQLIPDKAHARLHAQMAFAMLIGSLHLEAQLPKQARRQFFTELSRLLGLEAR